MSQSLYQLCGHLIFSTKDRRPELSATIRPRLYAYVAGIVRGMGASRVAVGGMSDHIHMVFVLPKEHSPVKVIQGIKAQSSVWLKTQGTEFRHFAWQRGYGLFSVGPTDLGVAEQYVETQEEHHLVKSFQDELRQFLIKYGIAYDERYLWD